MTSSRSRRDVAAADGRRDPEKKDDGQGKYKKDGKKSSRPPREGPMFWRIDLSMNDGNDADDEDEEVPSPANGDDDSAVDMTSPMVPTVVPSSDEGGPSDRDLSDDESADSEDSDEPSTEESSSDELEGGEDSNEPDEDPPTLEVDKGGDPSDQDDVDEPGRSDSGESLIDETRWEYSA